MRRSVSSMLAHASARKSDNRNVRYNGHGGWRAESRGSDLQRVTVGSGRKLALLKTWRQWGALPRWEKALEGLRVGQETTQQSSKMMRRRRAAD